MVVGFVVDDLRTGPEGGVVEEAGAGAGFGVSFGTEVRLHLANL